VSEREREEKGERYNIIGLYSEKFVKAPPNFSSSLNFYRHHAM
jgi:hypothetical protein